MSSRSLVASAKTLDFAVTHSSEVSPILLASCRAARAGFLSLRSKSRRLPLASIRMAGWNGEIRRLLYESIQVLRENVLSVTERSDWDQLFGFAMGFVNPGGLNSSFLLAICAKVWARSCIFRFWSFVCGVFFMNGISGMTTWPGGCPLSGEGLIERCKLMQSLALTRATRTPAGCPLTRAKYPLVTKSSLKSEIPSKSTCRGSNALGFMAQFPMVSL
jgi:hypothetical protein